MWVWAWHYGSHVVTTACKVYYDVYKILGLLCSHCAIVTLSTLGAMMWLLFVEVNAVSALQSAADMALQSGLATKPEA